MDLRELCRKCCCFKKGIRIKQDGACGMSLSDNCCAGKVIICKITGSRKHCARMASLGVVLGAEVELLCASGGAQCLLKINGATLSLDQFTSSNIIVKNI